MSEHLTSLLQRPSSAAIGLASSALLLSTLSGCAQEKESPPAEHDFTASSDYECVGTPKYIRDAEPYIMVKLRTAQGQEVKADEVRLEGFDAPFEHTGVPRGKHNRILVTIPLDVAHIGVSALKNGVRYTCQSLEYPNKPLLVNE